MDEPFLRYQRLYETHSELFGTREGTVGDDGYVILPPQPTMSYVGYDDPYVMLLRDRVSFPDGDEGSYLRVLVKPIDSPGVVILPIVDGRVVLLRQHRHATGGRHLELPRGFAEPGEDAETSARRELAEETGLVATDLHALGAVHPDSGILASRVALFLALCKEPLGGFRAEPGVAIETMSSDDLATAIASGEITDGFTLAAFLHARLRALL